MVASLRCVLVWEEWVVHSEGPSMRRWVVPWKALARSWMALVPTLELMKTNVIVFGMVAKWRGAMAAQIVGQADERHRLTLCHECIGAPSL